MLHISIVSVKNRSNTDAFVLAAFLHSATKMIALQSAKHKRLERVIDMVRNGTLPSVKQRYVDTNVLLSIIPGIWGFNDVQFLKLSDSDDTGSLLKNTNACSLR